MAKKSILIVLVGIALLAVTENTYASRGGHGGGGHWDGGHRGGGHFGPGVIIIPPRIRPVFCFPPRRIIISPTIVIGSPPPIVVEREVVVTSPPPPQETIVWIENDNGSKTEIRLTRASDGGYIGPRGEYYSTMPSEEQLKVLYGIRTVQAKPSNFTVWITNDNGSQTPVTLTPSGAGFVGPSNEYYPTMPTEEQLKALYGLHTNAPVESSVTVWIDNSGETPIPVVLTRDGDEYVGPKGERYANVPTKEQLKMIYGEKTKKIDNGSTVIWLTNADGSKMPITLQKYGSNYIGPAGEEYNSLPSEEQLKLLYGSEVDSSQQNELSFEVTKNDGTKTVVILKKEGSEFVGQKGERYPNMPTEEQLKLIYGK